MTIYFTSDTHFADPRVLRLDRRPFASIPEHDEALIGYWNEIVAPGDEVWHLGDFARGDRHRVEMLLTRLNGTKHLIIGNNDPPETLAAEGWLTIQYYAELALGGADFVLCHYPFRTWNKMGKGVLDLHGHSHGKLKPLPRQVDVGVDAWDFRPVTAEMILAGRRRFRGASQ